MKAVADSNRLFPLGIQAFSCGENVLK